MTTVPHSRLPIASKTPVPPVRHATSCNNATCNHEQPKRRKLKEDADLTPTYELGAPHVSGVGLLLLDDF